MLVAISILEEAVELQCNQDCCGMGHIYFEKKLPVVKLIYSFVWAFLFFYFIFF